MSLSQSQKKHLISLINSDQPISIEYRELFFGSTLKKEFDLYYSDKISREELVNSVMSVPLQPIRHFGSDDDSWSNMLIFGDNLQSLKTLINMKREGKILTAEGKQGVKLIYIDPPFASRQDFRKSGGEKAYVDRISGAKFIESIRQRLILIKELLSDDGSVFVHMDQRKIHYIKVIMDEIFGENNFRNEIILPGRAAKNLQQQFETVAKLNVRHDTLLWYSKSPSTRFDKVWVKKHSIAHPEGHWHSFWSTADRPTMRYPLLGHTPDKGQWTWKRERAEQAIESYKRYLSESGGRTLVEYWMDTGKKLQFIRPSEEKGYPQYWRPPTDDQLIDTVWSGIPVYSNSTNYPTEKSESLLRRIIEIASSEEDIVLDAFSGSGTTAAAAQATGRRWIAIDVGKLSIYTTQKRLIESVKNTIFESNAGFTLFNAGLYDFSKLFNLSWADWRFFALSLFQCRDEPHSLSKVKFDGYKDGSDVIVFDHKKHSNALLDIDYISSIHRQIKGKVEGDIYIIAPAASVKFLQDYIELDECRYWILRIPYSLINHLHSSKFTSVLQPIDSSEVNSLVESVGFDFMNTPHVNISYTLNRTDGIDNLHINLIEFRSKAQLGDLSQFVVAPDSKAGRELHLSSILIDVNYQGDSQGDIAFSVDKIFYAKDIKKNNFTISIPYNELGEQIMIIVIDIYGNEYTELKSKKEISEMRKSDV